MARRRSRKNSGDPPVANVSAAASASAIRFSSAGRELPRTEPPLRPKEVPTTQPPRYRRVAYITPRFLRLSSRALSSVASTTSDG